MREKSIDDPQGISTCQEPIQCLIRLMAKESISGAEVEVGAFSILNVYQLLLTTYIFL
jgi:hypothetical protein